MAYQTSSRSPPPLLHPVPTHPTYIPEPPSTPASPQGYQRFASTSSPPPPAPQGYFTQNPNGNPRQPYASQFSPPRQQPPQLHQQNQGYPAPGGNIRPGPNAQVPDFSAWGLDGATTQLGMQLGHSAVQAGQDYVQQNLGGMIPVTVLKHHFNVSNSYVMQKLRLLVFPWRHKPWSRRIRRSEQGTNDWQPPREDINSPDLYIPTMAFVTYVLFVALLTGLQGLFHPEILGTAASKALAVILVDFFFVKSGCYILNIQGSSQVLDLLAYGGYKFVGVIMTLVASLLKFGRTMYLAVFLYFFLANAFFLLRSLRSVVLPDTTQVNVGTVNQAQRSRRITFLFLVAMSQILYMWILVRV